RDFLAAGVVIGVAMGLRYNLPPLLLAVIGLYELLTGVVRAGAGRELLMKVATLCLLPVALFLLWPMIAYAAAGRSSIASAIPTFVSDLIAQFNQSGLFDDHPALDNYVYLIKGLTPLVAVAALVGVGFSLTRWPQRSLFFFLWLSIFFIFQTDLVAPKEARYLFILYVPLYYFVLTALRWLVERASPQRAGLVLVAAAVFLLAWPAVDLTR